jgi:hypothetical protein
MIRTFKNEAQNNNYEVRAINIETGEFTHYFVDKNIGFPFSFYETNVFDMGYKSVKECLKSLKERKF